MNDETILREAIRFKNLNRPLNGQEALIVEQAQNINYLKKHRKSKVVRDAYDRVKIQLGGKK